MTEIEVPQPNIPLLRKAVEWAEAEAAKTDGAGLWNQAAYAFATDCGTAFCIAGWTVVNASDVTVQPSPTGYGEQPGELVSVVHPDGTSVYWEHEAGALLGLTEQEAWALFCPENDIEQIRHLSQQIAARAGERL